VASSTPSAGVTKDKPSAFTSASHTVTEVVGGPAIQRSDAAAEVTSPLAAVPAYRR